MHAVEGLPLLGLPPNRASRTSRVLKRLIDAIGASIALIVLSPAFAYIALRIRLDSDGPIFFRQTRLGTNMKEFTALKFRTTKARTHEPVTQATIGDSSRPARMRTRMVGCYKLERADSVTPFGAQLRRTGLDELPQLINVLKGDMSLVGPRPCIPYETKIFEPHHLERFSMPQGITGLWQVTASANCTYGEAPRHGCRLRPRLVARTRPPTPAQDPTADPATPIVDRLKRGDRRRHRRSARDDQEATADSPPFSRPLTCA